MHSSHGIMVDNHPIPRVQPKREAWLLTIIPMATMHQLVPPLIGRQCMHNHNNNKFIIHAASNKKLLLNCHFRE